MAKGRGLSSSQLEHLWTSRWRARTDRFWFYNNVLGYVDLNHTIHGPIIDRLQKFPKPEKAHAKACDKILDNGTFEYTPYIDPYLIPDKRPTPRTLILDHRSSMKCCKPNVLLSLANGTYKMAKEIKSGDELKSLTEDYAITICKVVATEKQDPQPCYKITFRSGRELEVSYEHPFKFIDKWVQAKDLVVGDRVALINTATTNFDLELPYAEITGWMLGDGSFRNQSVTNESSLFRQKALAATVACGGTARENHFINRTSNIRLSGMRPLWRELGLEDKKSGDKFIPEIFFRSSKDSIKKLFYGLFMSDGTMNKQGIAYTSKSKQLVQDIQRLLVRFSIQSIINPTTIRKGKYAGNVYWKLTIQDAYAVERFLELVPWDKKHSRTKTPTRGTDTVPKAWRNRFSKYLFARGQKPDCLYATNTGLTKYDMSKQKLQVYADTLKREDLKNLCSTNLVWDFITDIEPLGLQETIAIQTSDGILVADDIVTHNTTANTIADTLYWLISFPHLCIACIFATDSIAQATLSEIKGHLQYNARFRELFPDLVPHRQIGQWGTQEDFTFNNRDEFLRRAQKVPRKESSVMTLSIDKSGTGYHVDLIKASDIVVPQNANTPGERNKVAARAGLLPRLLVDPSGWIYIEGTFYHPDDLHARIVRDWLAKMPSERTWDIFIRSIYKRDMGGKEPSYTPNDLQYRKWLLDKDGHERSIWEDCETPKLRERFSYERVNASRRDVNEGGLNWAYQFALDLNADESSDRPFAGPITWVERSAFEKVPIAFRIITVDLADTANERSNPSVFTVSAFDRLGRCFVETIKRDKFPPKQVVDILFELDTKYKPRKIFVEDYAFVHGLQPEIERRSMFNGQYPPFHFVKRERKPNEKTNRIIRALQPPYASGELRFVNPLIAGAEPNSKEEHQLKGVLIAEFEQVTAFSTGMSDDILDTLADIYLCREYWGPDRVGDGAFMQTVEAQAQIQKEQYEKALKTMIFGDPLPKSSDYSW